MDLRLGPAVDPAAILEDQAMVCTSPSVSSRFPTTEPRLRDALGALEREGRVPVVSEVDLFLRLCPARTVGVTGTKGKTTTSSMIAAVLAQGDAPVLLGGNIGRPLIEELPGLTPRHRVVLELSELQLPTLSRGTDLAVYTHVTADHLDRHGSIEAYRAVKRLLARLVRPDGALVLDDEDPVSRTFDEGSPAATLVRYRRSTPVRGGVGVADGWLVADEVPVLDGSGHDRHRAHPAPRPGARARLAQRLQRGRGHRCGPALGHRSGRHPGRAGGLRRGRASAGAGRRVGGRSLRQRFPGHPARCGGGGAARVRGAHRAHRGGSCQGTRHGSARDGGR